MKNVRIVSALLAVALLGYCALATDGGSGDLGAGGAADPNVINLAQIKAFAEITTFDQTYVMKNPKCQPLVAFTAVQVGRFHDQYDPYNITAKHLQSQKQADTLGCKEDNDRMWARVHGLYATFNRLTQALVSDEQRKKGTMTGAPLSSDSGSGGVGAHDEEVIEAVDDDTPPPPKTSGKKKSTKKEDL